MKTNVDTSHVCILLKLLCSKAKNEPQNYRFKTIVQYTNFTTWHEFSLATWKLASIHTDRSVILKLFYYLKCVVYKHSHTHTPPSHYSQGSTLTFALMWWGFKNIKNHKHFQMIFQPQCSTHNVGINSVPSGISNN